jgi:hypothetical protein
MVLCGLEQKMVCADITVKHSLSIYRQVADYFFLFSPVRIFFFVNFCCGL